MADSTIPNSTGISTTTQTDDVELIKQRFLNVDLVPLCVIFVIGFLGNLVVIFRGTKRRVLSKHYSNYFILSIAVADLGVVLMAIPINIVEYTAGLDISQFTCAFILPIRETFQCAALQSVGMLGVARLRNITKEPHIPISKRTSLIIIAVIWLNSYLLVSLPQAFVYKVTASATCDPEWSSELIKKVHITCSSVALYLPIMVATISYVSILKKTKNLWRPNSNADATARKSRNLSILLVLLMATCWISAMPLAVYMLLITYEVVDIPLLWWSVIGILYYSSSAINPLLVLIMNRDYRFQLPRRMQRKCRVGNVRSQREMVIRNPKAADAVDSCPHGEIAVKGKEEKQEEESG